LRADRLLVVVSKVGPHGMQRLAVHMVHFDRGFSRAWNRDRSFLPKRNALPLPQNASMLD
jgi:hypothetical protein